MLLENSSHLPSCRPAEGLVRVIVADVSLVAELELLYEEDLEMYFFEKFPGSGGGDHVFPK